MEIFSVIVMKKSYVTYKVDSIAYTPIRKYIYNPLLDVPSFTDVKDSSKKRDLFKVCELERLPYTSARLARRRNWLARKAQSLIGRRWIEFNPLHETFASLSSFKLSIRGTFKRSNFTK